MTALKRWPQRIKTSATVVLMSSATVGVPPLFTLTAFSDKEIVAAHGIQHAA